MHARCFASSSRSQAQKKKKVAPNPNAMSLTEAAHLLKVRYISRDQRGCRVLIKGFAQSLEVSRPFSAYEIEVVTRFDKSAPPLRGRISLPRDARKNEETVLVFAQGPAAEQAKAAGAKYVGGEDLIPLVRHMCGGKLYLDVSLTPVYSSRCSPARSPRPRSSQHPI
jgi:large subunit ribosomal protein L1